MRPDVPDVLNWIHVLETGRPVHRVNAFIVQELPTHFRHMKSLCHASKRIQGPVHQHMVPWWVWGSHPGTSGYHKEGCAAFQRNASPNYHWTTAKLVMLDDDVAGSVKLMVSPDCHIDQICSVSTCWKAQGASGQSANLDVRSDRPEVWLFGAVCLTIFISHLFLWETPTNDRVTTRMSSWSPSWSLLKIVHLSFCPTWESSQRGFELQCFGKREKCFSLFFHRLVPGTNKFQIFPIYQKTTAFLFNVHIDCGPNRDFTILTWYHTTD